MCGYLSIVASLNQMGCFPSSFYVYIYFDDGPFWLAHYEKKQGVCHIIALPFTKKYPKAEEKLGKLKYFTMQKYNLQKIL